MKKASLLIALCLFLLLPAARLANNFVFEIGVGHLSAVGLDTCPDKTGNLSCGTPSYIYTSDKDGNAASAPVSSYTGLPVDLGPANVGSITFNTPNPDLSGYGLYSLFGQPSLTPVVDTAWDV